jgi:hypothetical protein
MPGAAVRAQLCCTASPTGGDDRRDAPDQPPHRPGRHAPDPGEVLLERALVDAELDGSSRRAGPLGTPSEEQLDREHDHHQVVEPADDRDLVRG